MTSPPDSDLRRSPFASGVTKVKQVNDFRSQNGILRPPLHHETLFNSTNAFSYNHLMTRPTMSDSQDQTEPSSTPTNSSADMKSPVQINPHRAATLLQNLASIQSRIDSAISCATPPKPSSATRTVRLVAVSKLKPASDILSLHSPPRESLRATEGGAQHQLHFGENYVQELLEKARLLPRTIHWHFIGSLQSNKCAQLAREVESLWAVESCDSEKKAGLLNKGRGERNERLHEEKEFRDEYKLRVFIQVNTSGEESKSGLQPGSAELVSLAKFIRSDEECPHLHLQGLMTIGAIARSKATTEENENEDFITLRDTRDKLAAELALEDKEELELSMGMSDDFESAVRLGSSEVRVGSTIFGERPAKKDAKVIEDIQTEKK